LIKAFAKIAPEFKELCLVLIGRPGGAENKITQLIDSLGLSCRVHLYNGLPHDQILTIIKRAMIFVLPSRYEPFGIVILEAGAFGVPVIASNVGGIREILSHNDTGRLCVPEDVDSLADELRNLLTDQEERYRLGGNLRKHILENYSWEKTCTKYIEVINP
jgi:glycosyltransferase involved in cell wall biosynthesis